MRLVLLSTALVSLQEVRDLSKLLLELVMNASFNVAGPPPVTR